MKFYRKMDQELEFFAFALQAETYDSA
jgi:hypothetical protein